MSRQIAGNRKIFQDSKVTNPSQIKRQSHYHTKMSKARTVKDKDFQEITQSTAVPALFFTGSPPLKTLSPGLPGHYIVEKCRKAAVWRPWVMQQSFTTVMQLGNGGIIRVPPARFRDVVPFGMVEPHQLIRF